MEFLKRSVLQKGMVNCLIFLKKVVGFVLWWNNIDNLLWEFVKLKDKNCHNAQNAVLRVCFGQLVQENYCTMYQMQLLLSMLVSGRVPMRNIDSLEN